MYLDDLKVDNIRDKADDETVAADLTDRINDLKVRLESLIDDGRTDPQDA